MTFISVHMSSAYLLTRYGILNTAGCTEEQNSLSCSDRNFDSGKLSATTDTVKPVFSRDLYFANFASLVSSLK